jgi:small-conductance mechanosensitive channel
MRQDVGQFEPENCMSYLFMGNSIREWSIALAITFAIAGIAYIVRQVGVRRLGAMAENTTTRIDNLLVSVFGSTHLLFMIVIGFYVGSASLELTAAHRAGVYRTVMVALIIQAALWGDQAISMWLKDYIARTRIENAASTTSTAVLGFIARAVLWLVMILMILDNLGFNIATLVASLGIGGIAVALAVQNVLGDIFASLSIVLDKPFVVGDFIVVGDAAGTVEYIGLKTTRLRSLSGELIVFSNADLLQSRIHNYKQMQERRALFAFGVVYSTSGEQLRAIPLIVKQVIEALDNVRFDRAHFKSYGDSSLDFEVAYYLLVPDYNVFMDTQQAVNLAIFERFAHEKIDFAFPSRTVYLVNPPPSEAPGEAAPPEAPDAALRPAAVAAHPPSQAAPVATSL